jgi:glycosyltransferase
MNKGIRRSRGEVIIFMNANDYFISPFVVSRAEAVFRQEPGLDIVYGDYIVDSDEGQRAYRQAERIGASHFLMNRNLLHQSMFIRRRAFERLGVYNEALAITADRDWNIRAFVVERLAYRHLPLVVCMFDKHGASNTQSARSIVEIRSQIDRYYSWPHRLFWRLRLRCLSLRDRSLYRLRHRDFRPPRVMRELPERWARRRSRT